MSFRPVELLHVGLEQGGVARPVGRLARVQRRVLFEYDPAFLAQPLPLSPFHLPPRMGVFEQTRDLFDGLMGLFADSLPDSWGRLLLDRHVQGQGMSHHVLGPLDRLAYVGRDGPGALVYAPEMSPLERPSVVDLVALALEAQRVLDDDAGSAVQALLALGGSSGGARPKVQALYHPGEGRIVAGPVADSDGFLPVIVKFGSRADPEDVGAIELAYADMARRAGIEVAPTWLIRSGDRGFFATQRFDRVGGARLHMHSLAGLAHANPLFPSADYADLLKVTRALCRDERAVERVFRQMVFNVVAHNRDDHSRNFAFLMNAEGEWRPSPAYDLTFSPGPGGEHWMAVAGEGRQPGRQHILKVARTVGVRRGAELLAEVREAVAAWEDIAAAAGVGAKSRRRVAAVLVERLRDTR